MGIRSKKAARALATGLALGVSMNRVMRLAGESTDTIDQVMAKVQAGIDKGAAARDILDELEKEAGIS